MSRNEAEKIKAELQQAFEAMWEELSEWREQHPQASFDELADQVTQRRRPLMGKVLARLACQQGNGTRVEGIKCPECGEAMSYKGQPSREVEHLEGPATIARAYYHCAHCERGLFPPG